MGAMTGAPITPDQIKKIMDVMNSVKVVRVQKNDDPVGKQ
jgi:hypothetical protein